MSERISSRRDGHWLVFDEKRRITGCCCGFEADVDADCGWGDSVVDHIYTAGREAERVRGEGRENLAGSVRELASKWESWDNYAAANYGELGQGREYGRAMLRALGLDSEIEAR